MLVSDMEHLASFMHTSSYYRQMSSFSHLKAKAKVAINARAYRDVMDISIRGHAYGDLTPEW